MKTSDLFVRGRLIPDSSLIVFGDDLERVNAERLLRTNGFSFRSEKTKVAIINDFVKLHKYIKKFFNKELVFGISVSSEKRSLRQLRFYFGVIVHTIISFYKEHGEDYTKEQVHLDNLMNIWGWKPVEESVNGRLIIRLDTMPSTGAMSKETFSQFLKAIEKEYAYKGLDWSSVLDDKDGNQVREGTGIPYVDSGDGTLNQYYERFK